jgi:phosphohistidine phosphatase SixA
VSHLPEDTERQHAAERLPLQQIPRVLDLLDALNAQFRSVGHEPRIDYDYVRMQWALGVEGEEIARAATAEDLAKMGLRWLNREVGGHTKRQ